MWFLLVLHVIISLLLIIVVLMQSSKGGGLAGSIGGGMDNMMGGAKNAGSLLSRITTVLAILFMVSTLTIAVFSGRSDSTPESTVIEQEEVTETPSETDKLLNPGTDAQENADGSTNDASMKVDTDSNADTDENSETLEQDSKTDENKAKGE